MKQPLVMLMRLARSSAIVGLLACAQLAFAAGSPALRQPTLIPRESLGLALRTLARERGFQVVYVSGQVDHQQTRGASGDLTVEQALTQVLRGTGLTFHKVSDTGVVIEPMEGAASPASVYPPHLAAARPAPPPSDSAPAPPPALGEVTIEAEKQRALRLKVEHFVMSVSAQPANEALYRWSVPICPLVAGLPKPFGELILERISQAAVDAHAPLAGRVCHPNLFVVAHDDVGQLIKKWWAHNPTTLDSNDRGIEPLYQFFASKRPVRAWYNLHWQGAGGTGCAPANAAAGAALGSGVPLVTNAQACTQGVDTPLTYSSTRSNIDSAVVVIDMSRMKGMTTQQLADYIALIGLADVRLDGGSSPVPTILELFGQGTAPPALTRWDRALLYSLYNTSSSDRLQVPEMEITMVRRIAP